VAAVLAATSLAPGGAAAEGSQPNFIQRLRLHAQLQSLNSDLLSRDSATAVLQSLCDHRNADAPRIRARRVQAPDDLAAANVARRQLGAAANEAVRHRRVELMCGEVVLSRADNWYLPGRLTAQMNTDLESTERPFGVVIRELNFQRRTLSTRLLFQPLSPGWEAKDLQEFDTPFEIPTDVLQHRAILQTPNGRPFALLVETYSDGVLSR
jgi:chorismate-pyruvate lyase